MSTAVQPASAWEQRLRADAARARVNQTPEQRAITVELVRRGREAGASAIALTGSTARGRRTAISDLDYHVIGPRLDAHGLPGEVDIVTDDKDRFFTRLITGDDFAQWTLRFGCVLLDEPGVIRRAAELAAGEAPWPDFARKLWRAQELADLAEKVVRIGNEEAGQEHLRAALTAMARGLLLAQRVFPLARSELPSQLSSINELALGRALDRSIHRTLGLEEVAGHLDLLRSSLASPGSVAGEKSSKQPSDPRNREPHH